MAAVGSTPKDRLDIADCHPGFDCSALARSYGIVEEAVKQNAGNSYEDDEADGTASVTAKTDSSSAGLHVPEVSLQRPPPLAARCILLLQPYAPTPRNVDVVFEKGGRDSS